MQREPIYKSAPTLRNYEDYHDAEQYTNGWNDAMHYIFDSEEEMDCVTLDDVFDNTVKEKTFEENVLIELIRDMPKEMGVLYIQSFQQQHGPFSDEAADIIREYLSKE